MREMKGLVTGAGGLCGLRCVVFWHAVIKPSPTLTAQHLFTADFNFPDSPFPLPITPSHTLPRSLSLFLSLTHLSVAAHTLSLSVSPIARLITQLVPATTYYQGMLSCKGRLFSAAQTHLFYHHSFLSIYIGLGGKELLEHLGNVVCDFLNLAWG